MKNEITVVSYPKDGSPSREIKASATITYFQEFNQGVCIDIRNKDTGGGLFSFNLDTPPGYELSEDDWGACLEYMIHTRDRNRRGNLGNTMIDLPGGITVSSYKYVGMYGFKVTLARPRSSGDMTYILVLEQEASSICSPFQLLDAVVIRGVDQSIDHVQIEHDLDSLIIHKKTSFTSGDSIFTSAAGPYVVKLHEPLSHREVIDLHRSGGRDYQPRHVDAYVAPGEVIEDHQLIWKSVEGFRYLESGDGSLQVTFEKEAELKAILAIYCLIERTPEDLQPQLREMFRGDLRHALDMQVNHNKPHSVIRACIRSMKHFSASSPTVV